MDTVLTGAYTFAKKYIKPDETALWCGRPARGKVVTPGLVIQTLVALGAFAFCAVWMAMAIRRGGSAGMLVFGAVFIAIVVRLFWQSTLRHLFPARDTYYVITDRKLLIREKKQEHVWDGRRVPPPVVRRHKNGRATIILSFDLHPSSTRGSRHTLDDLADADGALHALEQMRQNVRQNPQEEDDSVEW